MRWHWALALLASASPGCQRCASKAAPTDAGHTPASFDVGMPAKVPYPSLAPLPSPQGYGLPAGCRFEGDVKRATLPNPGARFVAPRSALESLALSHDDRAGFVEFATATVGEAPWGQLDAPPLMDRSSRGWVLAWVDSTAAGLRRALLWRGGGRAESLAEGDELELADLACEGDTCVVLSSLVRGAAAPGGSWHVGKAEAGASTWKRIDLELGGDEAWRPLAIAGVRPDGTGLGALASDRHVALFAVGPDRAEKQHVFDSPHGAYDATLAVDPIIVVPGERTDRPCGSEEFPIFVLSADGRRHELRTPAPPESVIVRPLSKGAIVAWVAPVSCQHLDRRVVYATLLGPSGVPVSSPMAVADATGFALATRGDDLSLWLISGQSLSWVRARCS